MSRLLTAIPALVLLTGANDAEAKSKNNESIEHLKLGPRDLELEIKWVCKQRDGYAAAAATCAPKLEFSDALRDLAISPPGTTPPGPECGGTQVLEVLRFIEPTILPGKWQDKDLDRAWLYVDVCKEREDEARAGKELEQKLKEPAPTTGGERASDKKISEVEQAQNKLRESQTQRAVAEAKLLAPARAGNASAEAAGGAIAGGWQSAVVDGLASFVASRAEAELSLWLVENFARRLCPSTRRKSHMAVNKNLHRAAWFPQTCALLGDDRTGATLPGGAAISALREDMERLPYALLTTYLERQREAERRASGAKSAKEMPDGKAKAAREAEEAEEARIDGGLVDAARAVGGAIVALRRGTSPAEVLARWADANELRRHCQDAAATGRVDRSRAMIPCAMAAIGEAARWYQRACKGTYSRCEVTVGHALEDPLLKESLASLGVPTAMQVDVWSIVARSVEFLRAASSPRGSETPALEHARALTGEVLDSLADVIELLKLEGADGKVAKGVVLAMRAVQHAMAGEYADAARALVGLVDMIRPEYECDNEADDVLVELRRYVLLVADLAAAKDAATVQAALESAAAPVGGWRKKRRGFTVSVSAMVGLAGSAEWLPARRDVGMAVGPIAALGVDLSWPVGRRKNSTVGMFLSVLDLGQLVSARIVKRADERGEEGAKKASEVSVISVLSPGAYLTFGLHRTPLVIGAGVAYAPAMRTYFYRPADAPTTVVGDPFGAMRASLFIAVDATIFQFGRGRRR